MIRTVSRTGMAFTVALLLVASSLVASPVSAYNNVNADQILMRRANAVRCGTKIRIIADVVNAKGRPVRNAVVKFRLRGGAGFLGPNVARRRETAVTDSEGRARPRQAARLPYLRIPCGSNPGFRKVRARVPHSDAAARLKIWCGPSRGCDGTR